MEYRNLGKSGLKVSALSYGSWVTFGNQVDIPLAKKLLSTCYDYGINFFDNAEGYENGLSEKIMGKALKQLNFGRDTYCISSKVYWGGDKPTQKGISRKHIVDACNAALKRLQVDYLDLYFCHRPEQSTPIEETVWAMTNLIEQGKVLYWGTSEWSAAEIMMAHVVARQYNLIPPTMEQPQYNMLERNKVERDYLRIFNDIGLGTTTWSPLASGLLTGKYNSSTNIKNTRATLKGYENLNRIFFSKEAKENLKKVEKLADVASKIGCSLPQLAICWCLKNKNVSSVILGASKLVQLKENLKSVDIYSKINSDVSNDIENILKNKPRPPKY